MDAAAAAQPAAVPLRQGRCRICLSEGGGELVAPCLCKGTSKWVHRQCLNDWRARGSNPRALTNCCECGFQYRLQRTDHLASERARRRRQLMGKIAGQSMKWFVGVQLVISMLACLVRAIDSKESLVWFFALRQVEGHEKPGTFVEALKYHKLTYYLSGILLLLAITGFAIFFWAIYACCCRSSRNRARGVEAERDEYLYAGNVDECDVCLLCMECCCPRTGYGNPWGYCLEDCGRACSTCCHDCANSCDCCSRTDGACCPGGGSSDSDCCDCANVFLVLVIVVFGVLIIIGLFAAIVALVSALQKAGQEFAKIQQLRDMAAEYEVKDLADPADLGDAAPASLQEQQTMDAEAQHPATAAHTEEELRTQAKLEQELSQMHRSAPSARPWGLPSSLGALLESNPEQELAEMRAQNRTAASDA